MRKPARKRRFHHLLVLFLFLILTRFTQAFSQSEKNPHVLIINSYHLGFLWTDNIVNGIITQFNQYYGNAELYFEYLDTKRFNIGEIRYDLIGYFRDKYADIDIEVIIVSDNSALKFVNDYYSQLFSGIPVVFTGINDYSTDMINQIDRFTGVIEDYDIPANFELIREMYPEIHHIVIVNDNTSTGKLHWNSLLDIRDQFTNEFSFTYLTNWDLVELTNALDGLPQDAVIFRLSTHMDKNNIYYSITYMNELFERYCRIPVFTMWESHFGKGILGGYVISGREQGVEAAEMAIRILNGESATDIPVTETGMSFTLFNFEMMHRFGIKAKDLPEDSVIINEPETFYKKYHKMFWMILPLSVLQMLFIFILIVELIRIKKMNTEKQQMRTRLNRARKMESLGRLADGIAHDFNNLLTVIIGNIEFALMRSGDSDPNFDNMIEILKSAKTGEELTRQLQIFNTNEEFQPKSTNLNQCLREIEKLLNRIIGEDVTIRMDLDTHLRNIYADPLQLEQAVVKLIINARDSYIVSGIILIETRNVELNHAFIEGDGEITGEYVLLTVSDLGKGIEAEIFRSSQENDSTAETLGLGMVEQIVKQADGYLQIHSEPQKGTTYKIYFPVYRNQLKTAPKKTVPLSDEAPEKSLYGHEFIIVIEDSDSIRIFIEKTLQYYGYEVMVFPDGHSAVEFISSAPKKPAMLLADVVLPDIRGTEVAEIYRNAFPDMSILFMSGYSESAFKSIEKNIDPQLYIRKPFSAKEMLGKIRMVLDHKTD